MMFLMLLRVYRIGFSALSTNVVTRNAEVRVMRLSSDLYGAYQSMAVEKEVKNRNLVSLSEGVVSLPAVHEHFWLVLGCHGRGFPRIPLGETTRTLALPFIYTRQGFRCS